MGTQSARLWYGGHDHKEIFYNGSYHDEIHKTPFGPRVVPPTLIWKKMPTLTEFSMFFRMTPAKSDYPGNKLVDEYGARILHNTGGVITKCGAYYAGTYQSIFESGEHNRLTMACVGEGLTWVQLDPYLSYKGEICYTHDVTDHITRFNHYPDADGVWSQDGRYAMYLSNFYDIDGNSMLTHDISKDVGKDTKLFYDLDAMKKWLKS